MNIQFVSDLCKQINHKPLNSKALTTHFAIKNEAFGLQLELISDDAYWLTLDQDYSLAWNGLKKSYRLQFIHHELNPAIYFESAVLDDDGNYKNDRILHKRADFIKKGSNVFWIDLKSNTAGNHRLTVQLLEKADYQREKIVAETHLDVEIADFTMPKDNVFYLDLWQHLSALSRYYQVPRFSDDHFKLIKNYLEPLAMAGQKVCNLIVSDYVWEGQNCFNTDKNASSLFEYNIVSVYRKNGVICTDFKHAKRYIDLFSDFQMLDEINLFGIIDIWNRNDFGSPLIDYADCIRVQVFDEDLGVYDFIRTKSELTAYIRQIFTFLKDIHVWQKVKIMSDMPEDTNKFKDFRDFILNIDPDATFKYAIHRLEFLDVFDKDIESVSIAFAMLVKDYKDYKHLLRKHAHQLTFYSCWFPKNINQFIKSPLAESRLVGYFTYAYGFKGFLRWNYCLWTNNPDEDIRYKPERWAAGEMFFVYPGKNGRPELSLRWKQLVYGIQDFNLFKSLEQSLGKDVVKRYIKRATGILDDMSYNPENMLINCDYTKDKQLFNDIKKQLINLTKKIN